MNSQRSKFFLENSKDTDQTACIGPDKKGYPHNDFLFLQENIHCEYSLEGPQRGTSNRYPQGTF